MRKQSRKISILPLLVPNKLYKINGLHMKWDVLIWFRAACDIQSMSQSPRHASWCPKETVRNMIVSLLSRSTVVLLS